MVTVDCSVPGCEKPVKTKGWCHGHYMRWWTNGDVAAGKPLRLVLTDLDQRYAIRVDRNGPIPETRPELGPCWIWTGTLTPAGYGRMSVAGRDEYVHRWAYERFVAPIPDGFDVDHLCRNVTCVNTGHLEPVTHRTNTLRGESFMAHYARRTACKHGHEFTPENTRISPRDGSRLCVECNRTRCAAAHRRRRQLQGAVA